MDVASKLQNIELNEELIDADIENVQGVEEDEDMLDQNQNAKESNKRTEETEHQ